MLSSSGAEQIPTLTTEQQANALESTTMDAKLMVATASGDVQKLKDLVKKEESQMMVVVMAKQAAPVEKCPQGNMDPHLLALASSGSSDELQNLLNGGDGQASSNNGTNGRLPLPIRRASSYGDDTEANKSILAGVTAEGDTALHVVAACGQGDNFFTRFREAKHLLVQQNNKKRRPTPTERHALTTYGDGDNFLESARIIHGKDNKLLFVQNNKGDTPLHCAARAGKSNMVGCLIGLALANGGEDKIKELLRIQNNDKETALHQAVRVGNNKIVSMLIEEDSELASFPEDGGTSPMYLAIVLKRAEIVKTLYDKNSDGKLSFSGPNKQNALHAAVRRYPHRYRHQDLTKLLNWNTTHLCPQNKDLTTQRDENGSTSLHFAADRISSICRQVFEANPEALYQADHAGFFPIHVAASVGASGNIDMFVTKCPGSAGLRDAKGRTFLHVAVEEKEVSAIRIASRNLSLSWIMNMVDNDGNTALHLAVEAGSLRMFGALVANPQVNLNLPNNRGETPLDIAEYKIHGFYYTQSSEAQIRRTLRLVGAVKGVRRRDPLENNTTARVKHDESKITEVLKDSTGTLCIGSVLIATVTFGATFAVPGGYIADDHSNGGSPILARRYAFDAFIASNTLAFVSSVMATISLMYSGSPVVNPRGRGMHLGAAVYLLSISITSLAAAFALGAYVVLAPVSHKTAVATCVLSSLALLYKNVEFIWRLFLLLPPLRTRKGLIWTLIVYLACGFIANMLFEYWPLIFIFGWAAHGNPTPTLQAAPAQAPAALA